jgi:ribosomal protein L29
MRSMKPRNVHKLGTDELDIEVLQLRRKLFELESQRVTERIQDTSQFQRIKKDIARLLTEKQMRAGANS